MKAKLIYENIDFERGFSPKKALNIGKSRVVKKGDRIEVMVFADLNTRGAPKDNEVGIRKNVIAIIDEYVEDEYRSVDVKFNGVSGIWVADFNDETNDWEIRYIR